MPRRLVVNGDDFGLTPGVNAAIVDAHLRGILTSASLFANAPATGEAIQIALRTPTLGVGCHLALVDALPALPPDRLPTLAPHGRLRPTWGAFLRALVTRRIDLREVEAELTAQIERLVDDGIKLTHLDAHKHVHACPPVFRIVARLARRFGIRSVRVPWERPAVALVWRHYGNSVARRQALENLALSGWALRDHRLLRAEGLPAAYEFTGRALTGVFTETALAAALESVGEGVTELMTHPGYPDAALAAVTTRLRAERAVEADLLMRERIVDHVRRLRIVLVRHDGGVYHTETANRHAS